ncbi:MAG: hypothetical protein IT350_14465 [Deltaproteobacteria bacterium]|nr:hypothetical protein [Deltaproteobacteria bacterium]
MAWHPPPLSHWLSLYLKTLAIEIPIYALLSRPIVAPSRAILAAVLCSTITHPILIYGWPRLMPDYQTYIVSGEILVAIVESTIFYIVARPISWSRAIAASFMANGASFGIGVLVSHLSRG